MTFFLKSLLRGWTATEGCRVVCLIRVPSPPKKKIRYTASSELETSVLEIKHVTNVTKVLNETNASDRVSQLVLFLAQISARALSTPVFIHMCDTTHSYV